MISKHQPFLISLLSLAWCSLTTEERASCSAAFPPEAIKISGNSPRGSVHMTCMLEVTLASIQVSARGTVLRVMLARRVVSLSKAVAHSSSIYASQRQKQQVSHLWINWQGSTSKRFSSKFPIDRFKQSVTVTEREG